MFSKNTNDFFSSCFSLNFLFVNYGQHTATLKSHSVVAGEKYVSIAVTVHDTVKRLWVSDSWRANTIP